MVKVQYPSLAAEEVSTDAMLRLALYRASVNLGRTAPDLLDLLTHVRHGLREDAFNKVLSENQALGARRG